MPQIRLHDAAVLSEEDGVTRRGVLTAAAGVLLASGLSRALPAHAAEESPPVQTPASALEQLMAGNERYVSGQTTPQDFTLDRQKLTGGQQPFAAVLACADSRVVPEFAFDLGRGALFVVRVAGNIARDDALASLEYAVQYLNVPLVFVLGHTNCGAVKAAIADLEKGPQLPGELPKLVDGIKPAVRLARDLPGDRLANTIRTNVTVQCEYLKLRDPVLYPRLKSHRVAVVGGIYDLSSGRVEITARD